VNARLLVSSLVLSIALAPTAAPRTAHAQTPPRVELRDVTVDGQTPPESYRQMFAGAVDAAMAPIVRCYRDRIAAGSRAEGDLRLRLWVSARQVIRTTPEGDTLRDPELVTCSRARILEVRLPDSAPESGATVRFTLRYSGARAAAASAGTGTGTQAGSAGSTTGPGTGTTTGPGPGTTTGSGAGTTTAPPPPAEAPRAEVRLDSIRGPLGGDLVLPVIPTTAFDACPAGTGSLPLTLTVTRRGTLTVTQRAGNTLRPYAARRCVLAAVRALSMPTSTGTTRARITITLSR
jgi:hypothetical protein